MTEGPVGASSRVQETGGASLCLEVGACVCWRRRIVVLASGRVPLGEVIAGTLLSASDAADAADGAAGSGAADAAGGAAGSGAA